MNELELPAHAGTHGRRYTETNGDREYFLRTKLLSH